MHIQYGNFQKINVSQEEVFKHKGEGTANQFQDHAYEKWEGTLYSQRLKRIQDDPFSAASYIPAEFKEFKEGSRLVDQDDGIRFEDDNRTVLTGGKENYFLANDERILQGDEYVYENVDDYIDEPHQNQAISPRESRQNDDDYVNIQ